MLLNLFKYVSIFVRWRQDPAGEGHNAAFHGAVTVHILIGDWGAMYLCLKSAMIPQRAAHFIVCKFYLQEKKKHKHILNSS